jgi:tetratricopeptide (TPR) repeat protein
MIDPNTPAAGDALTQLRARVTSPQASAADWLAFGQSLLQVAGRNRDQQREALAALVQAYQLDPACDPTLLHTIAQTAFVLRDWPLVDSATALLLGRNAEDANALVWRAAAVQQHNGFDEAERLLREAVRVVPGNPVALHKLALCIKEQARFAEAETLLRRVLELSPNNAHAMFDLSELEIRSGRYADGWTHYESRIDSVMTSTTHTGRSVRSARTGRVSRSPAKRWSSMANKATATACGRCAFCRCSPSGRGVRAAG